MWISTTGGVKGSEPNWTFCANAATRYTCWKQRRVINPRSKSLKSYDEQFSPPLLSRTTLLNLKRDGKICNYPLYAVALFPRLGAKD